MQRNLNSSSTTIISQTLQNNPGDNNNLLKIITLFSFLSASNAQDDDNRKLAGLGIGCVFIFCLTLILCTMTKAKIITCCDENNTNHPDDNNQLNQVNQSDQDNQINESSYFPSGPRII